MTSTTRDAEITTDPDVPLVRIVREFDAPAAKVYRAHVDPDLVVRWMGPDALENVVDHWDARTGGSWRYHSVRGEESYGFFGSFHELRDGELIVQTFCFEGAPDGVALERLQLEDLPGGRCRLVATSLVDSFEGRDAFIASGMEAGVQEGYRRLDALLAG